MEAEFRLLNLAAGEGTRAQANEIKWGTHDKALEGEGGTVSGERKKQVA